MTNTDQTEFTNVPSGLGYYVTQTVNAIESAPSDAVNITLYNEAQENAMITSFEFTSIQAVGVINQQTGIITVTVPIDVYVDANAIFVPTIETLGSGIVSPISGVAQNFTNAVTYTVTAGSNDRIVSKTYKVIVTPLPSSTIWKNTLLKNVAIGSSYNYTLTPDEKTIATNKGISFIANHVAIYVPAANVKESKTATLTVERPLINTLYNANDPSWKTTIENPITIQWGNESSFYQPIEVELANPANKVFAKLVRDRNNKLYAIVQPSYTNPENNKLIGLASEPGLYALIEGIEKPYIQPLNNQNFRIIPLETDSSIYYTTNGQTISYHQPGDYTLQTADLNNWIPYTNYQTITVPHNELYAVAVKNQIISPISYVPSDDYVAWKQDIQTVTTSKVWTVRFSATVSKKTLYNDSIYVTDDSTSKHVPVTLQLDADIKSI